MNFKFVSHESFPDDQYVKEIVYLSFEDKYRVAFVRKPTKTGGLFWGTISTSAIKEGIKDYYGSFVLDSAFLLKDIQTFLNARNWEDKKSYSTSVTDVPF